jgi:hypothetical protein
MEFALNQNSVAKEVKENLSNQMSHKIATRAKNIKVVDNHPH